MKAVAVSAILFVRILSGYQNPEQIRQMEASGETEEARAALLREVQSRPSDVEALTAYAEFLDRYADPSSRQAYATVLARLEQSADLARGAVVARRIAALDLLAGDRAAVTRDLET